MLSRLSTNLDMVLVVTKSIDEKKTQHGYISMLKIRDKVSDY
jgi:hypothetical protein